MTYFFSILVLLLLFLLNVSIGDIDIPIIEILSLLLGNSTNNEIWDFVILEHRLPSAITSLTAGMSLSVSGLFLQTFFKNPLAGPSTFGINSGSCLMVSIVILLLGGSMSVMGETFWGTTAIIISAIIGAYIIIITMISVSSFVKSNVVILIVGLMIGYIISSVTNVFSYLSTEQKLQAYIVWGLGSFSNTNLEQAKIFAMISIIPLFLSFLISKPLNAVLVGNEYAKNVGYSIKTIRNITLAISGILSGIVTAFCGPISFIGLVVPHITKLFLKTDNTCVLIINSIIIGGIVSLLCNLLVILPIFETKFPINIVTPIIGAPVVLWVMLRRKY